MISRVCRLLPRVPRYALVGSNCKLPLCLGTLMPYTPLPVASTCLAVPNQAPIDQVFLFQYKHVLLIHCSLE